MKDDVMTKNQIEGNIDAGRIKAAISGIKFLKGGAVAKLWKKGRFV